MYEYNMKHLTMHEFMNLIYKTRAGPHTMLSVVSIEIPPVECETAIELG